MSVTLTTVDKLTDRRDGVPSQRPPVRFRSKTSNTRVQPTPADRLAAQKKREDCRERYALALATAQEVVWKQAEALYEEFGGHDINYFFEEIIQRGHLPQTQRAPSRWNAFVKIEVEDMNSKLPEGAVRYKSHQVARQLAEKWDAMSEEERIAITSKTVEDLAARKKAKATAPHHVALNAFHDIRANVERITKELKDLHTRTGTEILFVAVRSAASAFNRPFFFHTSDQISEFFSLGFKLPLGDVVSKLECFCLSGIQGMLVKHEQTFLELKKSTTALISNKLENLVGTKIHMNYANFDNAITRKFGLIIKNWPLPVFIAPGDIRTITELKVLHSAWTSEIAHFYRLTKEEFALWSTSKSQPNTSPPIEPDSEEFQGGVSADSPAQQDPSHTSPNNTPSNAIFSSYDIPSELDDLAGTANPQPTVQEQQPASPQPQPTANAPDENHASSSMLPEKRPNVEEVPVATKKRRQGLTEFTNTLVLTGTGVPVGNKKPRKERSDKGKKRPRKQ